MASGGLLIFIGIFGIITNSAALYLFFFKNKDLNEKMLCRNFSEPKTVFLSNKLTRTIHHDMTIDNINNVKFNNYTNNKSFDDTDMLS